MNPSFPGPVDRPYDQCDCHVTATNQGVIRLTAVLINPIYTHEGEGGWELSLTIPGGNSCIVLCTIDYNTFAVYGKVERS